MKRRALALLLALALLSPGLAIAGETVDETPSVLDLVLEIIITAFSADEPKDPPTPEIMGGVDPTG